MAHELTKQEKKIARLLIDKGVDAEFRMALAQAAETLSAWQQGSLGNKAAYHKLYKKLNEQDKAIANRYDNVTGSNYLLTVAQIYADGHITEEDIKDFSESTRAVLNKWFQLWNEKEIH